MADYKDRFEKWQKDAKDKFDEVDKQLGIRDKIEEGARVVAETAKAGADKVKSEANKTEVGKQAVKAAESTIKTAGKTAKKAWSASEPIRDVAQDAGEKAGGVVVEAGKSAGEKAGEILVGARDTIHSGAKTVGKALNLGSGFTRAVDSAMRTLSRTSTYVVENPLQAAATGASMAVGAGLGVVFTGFSSHWLFNSALPTWSVKKLGEQFNEFLKRKEELIEKGRLTEAEAERIRFERDIARRIGAPLLGAFSFASGAVMMTNVLNPKEITGAPIDWLLGGNPLLEGVWFFGNGMVCFKTSYDFFMIALDGHEDVEQVVKEVKGMLPKANEN